MRALGGLEAENLFGQFKDLDLKGTGVIRPDDIPNAISTAWELMYYRLDESKNFCMHTSKAKANPVEKTHLNMTIYEKAQTVFLNPSIIYEIQPKDNVFNKPERRSKMRYKRDHGVINPYNAPSKGARTIRQYHHCDEEKIYAEKRLPKPWTL